MAVDVYVLESCVAVEGAMGYLLYTPSLMVVVCFTVVDVQAFDVKADMLCD